MIHTHLAQALRSLDVEHIDEIIAMTTAGYNRVGKQHISRRITMKYDDEVHDRQFNSTTKQVHLCTQFGTQLWSSL